MPKRKPYLIIISGPSGVGKGTIIKKILKTNPNIKEAISATTRKPRPNEIDKIHYFFMSEKEFNTRIKNNEFLEWAQVHGNKYGTLKSQVDNYQQNGYDVLLEIDVQGAEKIKRHNFNITSIFITAPSFQDLMERLHRRNTEQEEIIKQRLAVANKEMASINNYDYIVVNNDLKTSVNDVNEIIKNLERDIIDIRR